MKEKLKKSVALDAIEKPAVILDKNCNYVHANEAALKLHKREKDELIGISGEEILARDSLESGKQIQKVLNGNVVETTNYIQRGDGLVVKCEAVGEPIEENGQTYVKITTENWSTLKAEVNFDRQENNVLEGVSDERILEIAKNIRIDSPEGEMTLNAIMLDLAVGHNELEQYKKGAFTLYENLDVRLIEEQERNPDSEECTVLKEVRDSAFGLYLRVEHGDAELHGKKNGEYSGYYE